MPESALLPLIVSEIRATGPITFARYMELCLYDSRFGYYTSGRPKLGPAGDFYTSAHVHSAFARLLIRRWMAMWDELGRGPFTVLEPGAGGGEIAREAQLWAASRYPEFAAQLRYLTLEYGDPTPSRFTGCIFTNEFFDAQPVHVLRWSGGEWEEMYVGVRADRLAWLPGPPSWTGLVEWIQRMRIRPAADQWVEISPSALRWMHRFSTLLERGYMISVDYGYRAVELNEGRRFPDGSLMTYQRHIASPDVFAEPGDRDLTAHVNWDTLIRAGDDLGLEVVNFTSQGAYLAALGEPTQFAEVFADCQTEADRSSASMLLKNLLFGIGETMQVLEQRKVQRRGAEHAGKRA